MSINEISSDSLCKSNSDSIFKDLSFTIYRNAPKRAFDIAFSAFALLLASPIFILVAVLIAIFSPGPILYPATRVGRGGKAITCWKFRTMCINAEQNLQKMLNDNPIFAEEYKKHCKLKKDPRVTFIGKILRKTSMDELPQFWNVLKGDLSVVGPRPYIFSELKKTSGERTKKILSVRPGLTGIWQTSGRSLLTFEERLQLEETYIDKQSFLFDIKLICKTIPMMLFPKGAY